uniref:Down syndrome cell adhesion molecule-like protein Dscam2 n=2 Tax=Lutzomyia longipalpis TaxID=7200 RepID=A0A1B0GKQ0_LUTLO
MNRSQWYTHNTPGEPLPVLTGPRIRLLGPVLAIEAVTSEDAGIYKCSAANAGGEASAELRLSVAAPLQVEITPNVLSVHMAGSAEFRCLVTSNGVQLAQQHITWFKTPHLYCCTVLLSKPFTPGPAVSLKCSAAGNPTPQVTWTLDGFALPTNGRFLIGQYVTVHGDVISHVNISHVMVEDGGEYSCIAENRAGKISHSARLNIYAYICRGVKHQTHPHPDTMYNVFRTFALYRKLQRWAGEDLHLKCPVAGYPIDEIHWERNGRELPDDIRQKVQPDGSLVISPVQKTDDSGVYTCWARNKQGHSARRSRVPPKLNPFHTTALSLNVGGRASLTCSVVKGDQPLTISWRKDGRIVDSSQRMSVTQVDQYNSILVIDSLSSEHSGNYSCVVRNQAAEVETSQALLVNDGLAEGMRTRTVCGVSRGDAPLTLRWLKDGEPLPLLLGANVTSLDQYSSLLSIPSLSASHSGDYTCVATNPAAEVKFTATLMVKGTNEDIETRKTTAQTTVLTGLRKYTNYSVQVLSHTRMGDGVLSAPTYCQTEEDAPEAPADIKVVVSSPQSLFVSWLPPNEPNGVITKYNLYTRVLSYEAKGLQAHVEYQFWVTASTRVGEGKSSRVASQITSNRARIISFGGLVVRAWRSSVMLSCQAVGQPRREWLKGDLSLRQNGFNNMQIMDTGELSIANLQMQDSGNYSCQVDNGVGTDRLTYNLLVQVPPASPVLYVTSATSSSILMHWKSGSAGNAPITEYTLHYKRAHGSLEELPLSRHASSHELKGLLCGSTYQIYLTASNKIGISPPSTTLHVRTQGQLPGIPATSALLAPNSTSVLLRLHAWPDNGCPILYFVLQYRSLSDSDDNKWILVSNALKPQRKFTITGLTPSTLYQLKMEAHNVAGSSDVDVTFVTLTKDGDPPPPELVQRGHRTIAFYSDMKFIIPIIITTSGIICTMALSVLCYKFRTMRSLLPLQLSDSTPGGASFHQVPIEGGTPDRPELSEAECDIDTLKKLKLGMRSSLWSRPAPTNSSSNQVPGHPSDYSIAV